LSSINEFNTNAKRNLYHNLKNYTTTNQATNSRWFEQISGTQVECQQWYLGRNMAVRDSPMAKAENYFCELNTHINCLFLYI